MNELILRPIGAVAESPLTRSGPHIPDLSQVEARIELHPELAEGLVGLAPGQRLDLLFWMHEVSDAERADLRVRSKRGSDATCGVFARRRPQRPNPIGVTRVELVRVAGASLVVRGCDAFPGTPVLDLKPAMERLRSGARVS